MIRTELADLIASKGWSQTQVARAIGKSPAVINQYLQSKYQGNVESLEADVQSFLNREREKARSQKITASFVATYTARRGLDVIRMAHLDGEINVIYGDAGLGKTMIMRQYAAENRDTILIEADPGYTARVVLEELCAKLGLNRRGNLHELSDACINELRESGRALLIDEAENLPYRALETIRRIHDKAGIGVVLAGMPRLIVNLKGRRGEYKQLYSRVAFALKLGATEEIAGQMVTHDYLPREDINQIAVSVLPDAAEPAVSDALFTASHGNARRLFKLLRGAHRHSMLNGEAVSAKAVRKFAGMLIN